MLFEVDVKKFDRLFDSVQMHIVTSTMSTYPRNRLWTKYDIEYVRHCQIHEPWTRMLDMVCMLKDPRAGGLKTVQHNKSDRVSRHVMIHTREARFELKIKLEVSEGSDLSKVLEE